MKKLLPSLIKGKWMHSFSLLTLLFSTSFLFAEEVLLGQYEFTTGADQTKPTGVVSGLTFSEIIINSAKVTSSYVGDAVETSNWGTSFNVNTGRCIQFSILKDATLSEFNVSRVDVTYKRAVAATKKMQLNAATFLNPNTFKPFSADVAYAGPDFETCSMTEVLGEIPAISDGSTQYLAVASQATAVTDVITFDKIEIYGTVTENLSPSIVTDISSKRLDASLGSPRAFAVQMYGANLTEQTSLSIVGTDASLFQIDQTSIAAATLNANPQTVNVTYAANVLTYNTSGKVHVPHVATLRIENASVPTQDIPISANTNLLMEDFSGYNEIGVASSILADLPAVDDNLTHSLVSGWTGDNLYAFRASSPNFGAICLGSSVADSAYLISPELDLSQPFNVMFKMRSLAGSTDGRFRLYLDGDQLINSGGQTNQTLTTKTSQAFVGTATSKIKLTGVQVETNQIVIDTIVVNYSSDPTLNVALNKEEDFGGVVPGSEKTIDIPLKAYNLTGDVTLSLLSGANFSIVSEATVAQATAVSGTTVSVKFTAPATTGAYSETLTLATNGMTNRTILLKASSDYGTGTEVTNNRKIIVNNSGVELSGYAGAKVAVYNLAGISISDYSNVTDSQTILINDKGCYILKIEDGKTSISEKVIIR